MGKAYLLASRFFQRRFFRRHFRHFTALAEFRAPQSRQIFKYNLWRWAIRLFTMSVTGMVDPRYEASCFVGHWIEDWVGIKIFGMQRPDSTVLGAHLPCYRNKGYSVMRETMYL